MFPDEILENIFKFMSKKELFSNRLLNKFSYNATYKHFIQKICSKDVYITVCVFFNKFKRLIHFKYYKYENNKIVFISKKGDYLIDNYIYVGISISGYCIGHDELYFKKLTSINTNDIKLIYETNSNNLTLLYFYINPFYIYQKIISQEKIRKEEQIMPFLNINQTKRIIFKESSEDNKKLISNAINQSMKLYLYERNSVFSIMYKGYTICNVYSVILLFKTFNFVYYFCINCKLLNVNIMCKCNKNLSNNKILLIYRLQFLYLVMTKYNINFLVVV